MDQQGWQPGHGGDTVTFRERYGAQPLDFSANTNPLGPSPLVRRAVERALDEVDRYPDPHCRALRRALSRSEGVPAEHILCGNGAADLIYRLALAVRPRRALLPAPTFCEYEQALALVECRVRHHRLSLRQDFALGESILEEITPGVDLLFLCEPNNPTGQVTPPALLRRIAEKCARTGTLLAVDECFNGFLPEPERHSCRGWIGEFPNLVVLGAFTKLHGMAGLRLGYLLCSNERLLPRISAAGQPWPVSSLAQAAGIAALEDTGHLRRTRELVQSQRERLSRALAALGCTVCPGQANYLLFACADHSLHHRLARKGILIRGCADYGGLGPGYYRVAVRTPAENHRLLRVMEELLADTR